LTARGVAVSFAGSPDRGEASLVAAAGLEFDPFPVSGMPRGPSTKTITAVARGARSVRAVGTIIERRGPDVVLGAGGYAGGPAVLAAALRRIPGALTEADAHLGLANRLAAPLAKRVFLAYPTPGRTAAKYRVVGRPIPARSRVAPDAQAQARRLFGLPSDGHVVLVCGGSLGALALNEAAVAAWSTAGPAVLHLTGERDHAMVTAAVSRPDYVVRPFTDEFGAALAAADLVVSRAGGVVWEIAAAGRPALLVPYPYATADHQTKNARYFARGGGAQLVPQESLDLVRDAEALLADTDRLRAMAHAMRRLARPDAADVIADELIALAPRGQR
jgi:UDP-N-acetylglucosamine--N-acetylmuramyl-(pentapeptide) pyrophosphoryl-undecaprenol N-acetylglucosamine transferase